MQTRVATYEAAHSESFKAMLGRCFAEDYKIPPTADQLDSLLQKITRSAVQGVTFLALLFDGETAVGFAQYQVDSPQSDWNERPGWGFLREWYVDAGHRGQGLGRVLAEHRCNHERRTGLSPPSRVHPASVAASLRAQCARGLTPASVTVRGSWAGSSLPWVAGLSGLPLMASTVRTVRCRRSAREACACCRTRR